MTPEAELHLVQALYAAMSKLWPMSPRVRRDTAYAIMNELHNAGVRVIIDRRGAPRTRSLLTALAFCSHLLK
jgi:hypothetical protein